MHAHIIENGPGNVVDVIYFCCDACHRAYCDSHPDLTYGGWNGCHMAGDSVEFCDHCGVVCGGTYDCTCQRDNVVTNRLPREHGEKCEHGNWVQLPAGHPALV